jgi:hypothetical protein
MIISNIQKITILKRINELWILSNINDEKL